MCSRIARVQLDRAFVFAFSANKIIIKVKERQAQSRVRFSQALIEGLRFKSKATRLWDRIGGLNEIEARQQNVRVSEACICQRVVGIESNGLIEITNCCLKIFLFAFAPREPTLQIKSIRLRV